jgi:hypothetical protein
MSERFESSGFSGAIDPKQSKTFSTLQSKSEIVYRPISLRLKTPGCGRVLLEEIFYLNFGFASFFYAVYF